MEIFRTLPPSGIVVLVLAALGLFILLLFPSHRQELIGFYCVTEVIPLTVFIIEPDEWDSKQCFNEGPRGERSTKPMTVEERKLLPMKRIPFVN